MFHATMRPSSTLCEALAAPSVVSDNEQFISEFLEWKKSYAPAAGKGYAVWIRRFQNAANKPPERFELGDWTRFSDTLRANYAPKSIQFALSVIRNYLRFWQEQGRLKRFPLHLARVPKAIVNSHEAIEEGEYSAMIEVLRGKGSRGLRDLAIVMMLHDTGMRIGELLQLEIEQIEEDASATIHSEKTVNKRRVFWNRDTDEVIHALIVERTNNGPDCDWLFVPKQSPSPNRPLSARSVQRMFKKVAKEAEIERKLPPHSFRHAFIHRMAALSVPDAIIAQLVGHSTPHTIATYTKLSRPEFREFACRQFVSTKDRS